MDRSIFALLIICLLLGCSERGDEPEPPVAWPVGYVAPINDATFSLAASHLPNAPREYRSGTHQGFDFFNGLSGTSFESGQPVVAVSAGVVVRADANYQEPSPEALRYFAAESAEEGLTSAFAMDQLRGRQVWLRHDNGFLSIYAHLDQTSKELAVGSSVEQGQQLGIIGSTGVLDDDTPHLHFELRSPQGEHYLGEAQKPREIYATLARVFGQASLPRYAQLALTSASDEMLLPPESLPESTAGVRAPERVESGAPIAISVAWESDQYRPSDIQAVIGNAYAGVLDAGNGVWLLSSAPLNSGDETRDIEYAVSMTDAYGQTASGANTIKVVPTRDLEPVNWPTDLISQLTPDALRTEQLVMNEALEEAWNERTARWNEPFQPPIDGRVERRFGQMVAGGIMRPQSPLPGVVIRGKEGDGVQATNSGRVSAVVDLPARGTTVIINHGAGVISLYAHLESVIVSEGDSVQRGTVLGTVGASGLTPSIGLRFEIHTSGGASDPLFWFGKLLPGQASLD